MTLAYHHYVPRGRRAHSRRWAARGRNSLQKPPRRGSPAPAIHIKTGDLCPVCRAGDLFPARAKVPRLACPSCKTIFSAGFRLGHVRAAREAASHGFEVANRQENFQ